jgi:hypothetical protein
MATATYVPIATQTLSTAASSITFSSIPSTYTDLRIVFVPISTSANGNYFIFNSDTSALYSQTLLYGIATSAGSANATGGNSFGFDYYSTGTTPSTVYQVNIFSYAGSTYKTLLINNANDRNSPGAIVAGVGLYRSTSAITSVTFNTGGSTNFAAGTTATLWGI